MFRSSKPAAAAGPAAGDIDRLLHGRRSAAAAKYAEQGQYNGTVSVSPSVCLSQHGPTAAAGPAAGDIARLLHGRRSAAAAACVRHANR